MDPTGQRGGDRRQRSISRHARKPLLFGITSAAPINRCRECLSVLPIWIRGCCAMLLSRSPAQLLVVPSLRPVRPHRKTPCARTWESRRRSLMFHTARYLCDRVLTLTFDCSTHDACLDVESSASAPNLAEITAEQSIVSASEAVDIPRTRTCPFFGDASPKRLAAMGLSSFARSIRRAKPLAATGDGRGAPRVDLKTAAGIAGLRAAKVAELQSRADRRRLCWRRRLDQAGLHTEKAGTGQKR